MTRTPWSYIAPLAYTFSILILLVVSSVSAQDAYLRRWVVQDPGAGLVQDVASRTINSINYWVTRENVASQTARLDDRLEITVIGRHQPTSGEILEEIVRIRAGGILLEDDPHLFLSEGLIDTLITRNYRWRGGEIEILDRSLAPKHMTTELRGSTGFTPSPTWSSDRRLPLAQLEISSTRALFIDPGDLARDLPGLSLGAVLVGADFSFGTLWGELPIPGTYPAFLGPVVTPSYGIGASVELNPVRVATGIGIASSDSVRDRVDSVRIGAWALATLHYDLDPDNSDAFKFSIDGGASLREILTPGAPVNGVSSEHSTFVLRPYAEVCMVSRSGLPGTHVEQIAIQTSLVSASVSARLRISQLLHLTGIFSYHGLFGERDLIMPTMTLWITPGISF